MRYDPVIFNRTWYGSCNQILFLTVHSTALSIIFSIQAVRQDKRYRCNINRRVFNRAFEEKIRFNQEKRNFNRVEI